VTGGRSIGDMAENYTARGGEDVGGGRRAV